MLEGVPIKLPANGEEYTPSEAINILVEIYKENPSSKTVKMKHVMMEMCERGLIPVQESALRKRFQQAKDLMERGRELSASNVFRPWRETGRAPLVNLEKLEEWAVLNASNDQVVGKSDVVEHLNQEKIDRKLDMGFVSFLFCAHIYVCNL